jgi:hypothetical protein
LESNELSLHQTQGVSDEDGAVVLTRDGDRLGGPGAELSVGGGAWSFSDLPVGCRGGPEGERAILLGYF